MLPKNIKFLKSPRKFKKYRVTFELDGRQRYVDFGDNRYGYFPFVK